VGPTQLPVRYERRSLSPGAKRQGRQIGRSNLRLVPGIQMRGAVPPLAPMLSYFSA
jgi:hypothetical protein